MVTVAAAFDNILAPGVSIVENTAGFRTPEIASHNAIYMFGSATAGETHTPTLIRNVTDFLNQFGGSNSEASVRLLFRNHDNAIVYFTRVGIGAKKTVTIDSADVETYTLAISGEGRFGNYNADISYEADALDTLNTVTSGLIEAINVSTVASEVSAVSTGDSTFLIRTDAPGSTLTATVTAGSASVVDSTSSTPTAQDYVSALEGAFDLDDEWPQGFVIAPEAFRSFTTGLDRVTVGAAMENLVSNKRRDWVAIIDPGPGLNTVEQYKADAQPYSSPQGHVCYYLPYFVDLEGTTVPPSAAIAGINSLRFSQQGYHQPAAGPSFPVAGVVDVTSKLGYQEQSVLNPLGINVIRKLQNKGICVWAMRNRTEDAFYRFTVHRVIMNVLNGTLRRALDFELFNSIDGAGVRLERIEETCRAVCRQMWIAKALFGEEADEAYQVICSFDNNSDDQLERGNVLVEVYVAPSPAIEKILIATYRAGIGQVQQVSSVQ